MNFSSFSLLKASIVCKSCFNLSNLFFNSCSSSNFNFSSWFNFFSKSPYSFIIFSFVSLNIFASSNNFDDSFLNFSAFFISWVNLFFCSSILFLLSSTAFLISLLSTFFSSNFFSIFSFWLSFNCPFFSPESDIDLLLNKMKNKLSPSLEFISISFLFSSFILLSSRYLKFSTFLFKNSCDFICSQFILLSGLNWRSPLINERISNEVIFSGIIYLPSIIFLKISSLLFPGNACWPVNNSYVISPKAHISILLL